MSALLLAALQGLTAANGGTPPFLPDPDNKTADPYRSTPKPRNPADPTFGGARPDATATGTPPSATPPNNGAVPAADAAARDQAGGFWKGIEKAVTGVARGATGAPAAAPPASTATPQGAPVATDPYTSPGERKYFQDNPGAEPTPPPAYSAPSFWKRLGNVALATAGGAMSPKDQGGQVGQLARSWQNREAAAKQAPADFEKNLPTLREQIYQKYLADQKNEREANKPITVESGGQAYEQQQDGSWKAIGTAKQSELPAEEDQWLKENPGKTIMDYHAALKAAEVVPGDKTGAEKPEIETQIGPKPTSNVYAPPGKPPVTYKSVAEAQAAWGKNYEAGINREGEAAGQARGEAYAAGRLNNMYDMLDTQKNNTPVKVTGHQILDEPGRYMPAGPGEKALKPTAQFEDIRAGINALRPLTKELDKGFTDRAAMAGALAQGGGVATQWAIGELDRGHLTEKQFEYVDALNSLMERVMSLRAAAGMGQGSDELRRAILAAIPGAGTPDSKQALDKLARVENLVDQLERGIPQVTLNPTGSTKKANTEEAPKKWNPQTGRYE